MTLNKTEETRTDSLRQPKADRTAPKSRSWRRGSRIEKSELLRDALLQAAAAVVGEVGYANASIALITAKVGVAQGTFYNYFDSRQDILDALLPTLGDKMLAHIKKCARGGANFAEIENNGFRGFFSFLKETPHFFRILNEAESFAPSGHKQHFDNVARKYLHLFQRLKRDGAFPAYTEDELEVVVFVLMAARSYLALRYIYGKEQNTDLPEWVADTYMKFIRYGMEGVPPAPQTPASNKKAKQKL
ncbi:MAG: TetR/AcrR family transcriptional regulator [Burkholderiales bacterium]|nr:TetR/AcrR family transcriptional regulator [Burkholderiales bacterium]